MTALWLWMRRCLTLRLLPVVVVLLVAVAWPQDGWQYEWLLGGRRMIAALPLVAALLAGAVAHDAYRHWAPTAAQLGPATKRWRRVTGALLAAHLLWASAGVGLVLAAAHVRLWSNSALGRPDLWLPFEALAALASAAAVGLAAGMTVRSPATPPLVAAAVLAGHSLNPPFGLNVLFAPPSLSSSAIGIERDPSAAAMTIAVNVAFASVCCLIALRGTRTSPAWAVSTAVATAGLLAVLAVPASATPEVFRAQSTQLTCVVQGQVEVCGVEAAGPFLVELARGLDDASAVLGPSELPLPTSWTLGVPGTRAPSDQATAAGVSPASLRGESRTATVARVLSQPRLCPQLYDSDEDTTRLLDLSEQVNSWIGQSLRDGAAGRSPAQVLSAYQQLLTCQPAP